MQHAQEFGNIVISFLCTISNNMIIYPCFGRTIQTRLYRSQVYIFHSGLVLRLGFVRPNTCLFGYPGVFRSYNLTDVHILEPSGCLYLIFLLICSGLFRTFCVCPVVDITVVDVVPGLIARCWYRCIWYYITVGYSLMFFHGFHTYRPIKRGLFLI